MGKNQECNIIKISIIVPVYNSGSYLKECLDTIVNQSLKEIEIILIVDNPTDGSDVVCEQYALKDKRIKIVKNIKNRHIGESRNLGLKIAKGEYIGFSDHDDYRSLDMYRSLYDFAKKGAFDIVLGPRVDDLGSKTIIEGLPTDIKYNKVRAFALNDLLESGGTKRQYPVFVNIHSNIYRRELLESSNVLFADTRVIVPEDRLFNIECLLNTEKVGYYDQPLYFHRYLVNSEGHNLSYYDGDKWLNYLFSIYEYLNNRGLYCEFKSVFLKGTSKIVLNSLSNIFFGQHRFKYFYKRLKVLKKLDYVRESFMLFLPMSKGNRKRYIFDFFVSNYMRFL